MRFVGRHGLVVLGIVVLYCPSMAIAGGRPMSVPEMDAGSAVSAVVLALGALTILRDRWLRK